MHLKSGFCMKAVTEAAAQSCCELWVRTKIDFGSESCSLWEEVWARLYSRALWGDRAQPGPHPRKKNGILVLLKQSRSWGKPRGWILQGVPEEAKPSLELLEVLQAPSSEWALLSFPFWKKWDRSYCKHWGIPNPTGSLNCHTGVTNIETSQIPQDLLDCYTRDKHWDIPNPWRRWIVTDGSQTWDIPNPTGSLETLNCHTRVTKMGLEHPKSHRIPGIVTHGWWKWDIPNPWKPWTVTHGSQINPTE